METKNTERLRKYWEKKCSTKRKKRHKILHFQTLSSKDDEAKMMMMTEMEKKNVWEKAGEREREREREIAKEKTLNFAL